MLTCSEINISLQCCMGLSLAMDAYTRAFSALDYLVIKNVYLYSMNVKLRGFMQ